MSSSAKIRRRAASGRTSSGAALLLLASALIASPALAQADPGRRGPPGGGDGPTPQWIVRERHEIRRDVREDGMIVERRRVTREQWQQVTPEERQRWMEQRRQMRQLSPEERQQLRRDILEAYKPQRE